MEAETFYTTIVGIGLFVLVGGLYLLIIGFDVICELKEIKAILEKPEKEKKEIEKAKKLLNKKE